MEVTNGNYRSNYGNSYVKGQYKTESHAKVELAH